MADKKKMWTLERNELFELFKSSYGGITEEEAGQRLEKYGHNELISEKKKSVFKIFLEQFADFLVLILIVAALVSAAMGDVESTVVILAVITMNAVLGTIQTVKASASLDSLKKMSAPTAKVVRDGQPMEIPGSDVVPGDVVLVEAGDSICADGRLIECASLSCAESALTGESLPVEKNDDVIEGDAALGDRSNMVFSGCFVTYGRGRFIVTGTGMDTEMGGIATLLNNTEAKKTPLQVSLDQFGRKLSIGILVICAVIFAVSVFVRHEPVMNALLFAIALAVAAIPEALSSIVTIVLSFGTRKMAQEQAIIRKLQAVEGLGSVSVICSDKTGTLTQNKMTVKKLYAGDKIVSAENADFADYDQEALLCAALLCTDATVNEAGEVGDPTETALVRLGLDYGFDAEKVRRDYERVSELPFDSDRKLMSTVNQMSGGIVMFTKGAVDVLLDRTNVTEEEYERIEEVNEEFSRNGLRVLAFACRHIENKDITLEDESDLKFLGLIAMMDPPREASKGAVAQCIEAGIRPVMITGDHKVTASAIARELGILTPGTLAIEGRELDGLSDQELKELVPKVSVYARVSPEHKIRIVHTWQNLGKLVAMTGDGVNDAPALKQADIGVAMGITGTEVSKEAAGMVLADDNFATIIRAVKNGRNIYANIKRAIQFLLSGNAAGIITVLYASLLGLPVPFAAVHLLFINLLTDSLPAIALGLEPHTDAVMHEKPRPRDEGILTKKFFWTVVVEGFIIAIATIAAFYTGLINGGAGTGSTMAFATLCLSRLFHGFNCKSESPVIFSRRLWNNPSLLGAFAIGAVLLGTVMLVPAVSGLFQVVALPGKLLAAIVGLAFGSMLAIQLIKKLRSLKNK